MTDVRDPMALVRHTVQVGDWRLLELLARTLAGHPRVRTRPIAQRAYGTLVGRLGLNEFSDYDRR